MTRAYSPPAHIVIVDDTKINLDILKAILELDGYQVTTFSEAPEALTYMKAHVPDLAVLDIMMPIMTGFQLCEELKAHQPTSHVPIIFISAIHEPAKITKGFQVGAVDFVVRPYRQEEVRARVRTHLTIAQLQRSLRERIAELDLFTRTVAHDLKNPLTVIKASAELLSVKWDSFDAEKQERMLSRILTYSQKMAQIVEEMLLLAQVQRSEMERVPLDTGQIIEQAILRLQPMIESSHGRINLPETDWPIALGYPGWIEEVWVNLISNAIKYGGWPPEIKLGANLEEEMVRFWVRDNGDGITQEAQAALFTEFTRLHVKKEGHGLGLTIVKQIVEKLGGEVGLNSRHGEGSCFYFTLPRLEADRLMT